MSLIASLHFFFWFQTAQRLRLNQSGLRIAPAACSTQAASQTSSADDATKEEHEFQAETRQLLDIVARSLYSEKEVFVRSVIFSV